MKVRDSLLRETFVNQFILEIVWLDHVGLIKQGLVKPVLYLAKR